MNEDAKKFCTTNLLPDFVCSLLELYGISFIEDLVGFGQEDITEIERNVREGNFGGHVDFESKSNRIKYLGFDVTDLKSFLFRPIDKKKLLSIGLIASQTIE